jgi:cbb3-type cytochrome oxidase subunit 3
MGVTLPVVIGAVLGWLYDQRARTTRDPEATRRMGVLMATGLIVGDSLLNVAFAGLVYASDSPEPMALAPEGFGTIALIGGTLLFALITFWLYRRARAAA